MLDRTKTEFLILLGNYIRRVTLKFREQGYYMAITNIFALLGFASTDNVLIKAMVLPAIEKEGSSSENNHSRYLLLGLFNSLIIKLSKSY